MDCNCERDIDYLRYDLDRAVEDARRQRNADYQEVAQLRARVAALETISDRLTERVEKLESMSKRAIYEEDPRDG